MQTYSHSEAFTITKSESKARRINLTALWEIFEANRFGATPVFLVIAVCLGGFAAAVALPVSIVLLSIVGATTGAVLVLLIAVSPMRIVFWFFILSILVDLFVFFS
jgi:hypothetical protein